MLKVKDQSFGPERVKEEILEKIGEKGVKSDDFHVNRFEAFHSITNEKKYHMYVVKAENADIMNTITSIFGICNMVCKFERLLKRETQCFNCYNFGNSQKGSCFNLRRCKKCLSDDPNHECKEELVTPTEENVWNPCEKYQCCGCEKFDHPPTHSKCEKYIDAIAKTRIANHVRNERRWDKRKNVYTDATTPTTNVWQRASPVNSQQQQQTQWQPAHQGNQQGFSIEDEVIPK